MRNRRILISLMVAIGLTIGGCAENRAAFNRGVVASDHPLAAEAGARILRLGGNAVDAAVATSFALSVLRPESCGIGGGGFMLIHLRNDPRHGSRDIALDYRERAPAAVRIDTYERLGPDAARFTGAAVAVPGTVAGLLHALDRYGSLDRATILAPAIELAQRGYPSDQSQLGAIEKLKATIATHRAGTGESDATLRRIYVDAPPMSESDSRRLIRNPEQARALSLIADEGAAAFYGGAIGHALVDAVTSAGGFLTLRDLESYRITEARPLEGAFLGRRVLAMPLPSSGGLSVLHILRLVELREDLRAAADPLSPAYLHLLVEAFNSAFADRAAYLGDPEYAHNPTAALLDDARLRARAVAIDPNRAHAPDLYTDLAPIPDDHGTSHLCAVDRWGSAVACTETINLGFGSRLAVPEFGFCLNNEMDDFLTRQGRPNAFGLTQSTRNLPEPGKRPLSSMSPTIMLSAKGEVELVVGASGGPRIITAVAQAILNAILFHLPAADAVASTRIHHQWKPDEVSLEAIGGRSERENRLITEALVPLGHTVGASEEYAVVQLIHRQGRRFDAAADPRKHGAAVEE